MSLAPTLRPKKWGGRTQWSKGFFTMVPDSQEDDGAEATTSTTAKPKKQLKKAELAPTTRWRCRRCGQLLHPPMDPHTRRPCLVVLADHLEGLHVRRVAATTEAELPVCTASTFLSYGEAVSPESEDGAEGTTTGKRARGEASVRGGADGVAAQRDALRALLFPASEHTHDEDSKASSSPPPPRVFVVVENPKNPRNLGSILRAMHNYGCDAVNTSTGLLPGAFIYSGTRLDKALRYASTDALATDTVDGAQRLARLSLPSLQILFDVLHAHAAEGTDDSTGGAARCTCCAAVAVDLIEGATSLPFFQHPFSSPASPPQGSSCAHAPLVFYLFGPEDGTLSEVFLRQCHAAVFMPTIASMNLAASVAVLLYDRTAKACLAADERVDSIVARVFSTRNANNRLQWYPTVNGGDGQ